MSQRARVRRRAGPVRAAAALAVAALACGGAGPYETYRRSHPGWEPSLPDGPGSVEELVAALHAPEVLLGRRVTLGGVAVFDVAGERWRRIDPAALGGAPRGEGDFAVIARRVCRADDGFTVQQSAGIDYYLLRGARLAAYAHTRFQARCARRERFRAARTADAALEIELLERIQREHGRRRIELPDLYRRGLAYVEAGRPAEARSWLEVAERTETAAREGLSGPAPEELAEASALRGRLRRALGLPPGEVAAP